jgi:hypothetical protein
MFRPKYLAKVREIQTSHTHTHTHTHTQTYSTYCTWSYVNCKNFFKMLVTYVTICSRYCPKKLNYDCHCLFGTKRKFLEFPPAKTHSTVAPHTCRRAICLTRQHLIISWVLGSLTYTWYSTSHNNIGSSLPQNICYITTHLKLLYCFTIYVSSVAFRVSPGLR